jgi:hypothetical protein
MLVIDYLRSHELRDGDVATDSFRAQRGITVESPMGRTDHGTSTRRVIRSPLGPTRSHCPAARRRREARPQSYTTGGVGLHVNPLPPGVVASLLGVAGGELLIPTLILLFGIDIKLAGSLSLALSLPTMLIAFKRYSRDKVSWCLAETACLFC